jgi:hypothetical protein
MEEYKVQKIALLFPMEDGQTGLAIKEAFESLGYSNNLVVLDPNTTPPNEIVEAVLHQDPDLIFCGREESLIEPVQKIKAGVKSRVVVWNPDVRDDVTAWAPLFPLFRMASAYYTVGYGNVQAFRDYGINAFWLPQGLFERKYRPLTAGEYREAHDRLVSEMGEEVKEMDKPWEVSFIGHEYPGNLHAGREEVLDILEGLSQSNIPVNIGLFGCRGGIEVWDEDHNFVVMASDINVAHNGWSHVSKYWSQRVYKILGAGGFCLCNYHKDMEDWVPIEGDEKIMGVYHNAEDLEEKIDYYLDHPKERKEIAKRGRLWALKNTYRHRMMDVIHHVESSQFYYQHYKDIKDCDRVLLDPRAGKGVEEGEEDKYIATIFDRECIKGGLRLLQSIDHQGFSGVVVVFTQENDAPVITEKIQEMDLDLRVDVALVKPWYDSFTENYGGLNVDPRYFKPCLVDCFEDGDKVLFLDGADTLVLDDDLLNVVFDKLEWEKDLLITMAEEKDTIVTPGYVECFDVDTDKFMRFNSGVFAFKKSDEAMKFFRLWKAFCAWSLAIGHGDQAAFMMALNTLMLDSDLFPGVLDIEFNYLPAFPLNIIDNKVRSAAGKKVVILHGAGGAFERNEDYIKAEELFHKEYTNGDRKH